MSESPSHRKHDPARQSIPLAIARSIAKGLCRLLFRIEMQGLDHLPTSGPVLLAGNHTGWLDGPLVQVLLPRPCSFLAKSELYDTPFKAFLEFSRQIPINRGTPDRTAVRRALGVLAGGGVLGMFPEGTRGEGKLDTVQHGIGYIAVRSGCPIVPIVCTGTADALPKGKKLPKFRAPITIVFGPSFTLDIQGDPHARSTFASAAEQIRLHLLDHLESAGRAAA